MKKSIIKFIIPLAAIPFLANCGGGGGGETTHYVTFHQELADDFKLPFTSKTTDSEIIAQEPAIVEKDGFDARWEDYTVVNKKEDFTVNAIYTAQTYYVTFKSKGTIVDTVPFTKSDITGEHSQLPADKTPACPQDGWWKYHWEDYSLSLNNITVNAVAGELVQHKAVFKDGDKTIGDPVNFTREDIGTDYVLPDSKIPDAVKNYKHDPEHPTYWDNNWNFKVPEGAGETVTFDANVSKHNFDLKFVDFDGEQIGEIKHYQFDSTWDNIVKPEAPSKVGYTTGWPTSVTWSFDVDAPQVIEPTKTANQYTITFKDHPGDSQTVTYGQAFQLKYIDETQNDLFMFYDNQGKLIPSKGVWNIPNNVSELELRQTKAVNFESGYIPAFVSTASTNTLSIVDDATKGYGVLKIDLGNPSVDSIFMQLSKAYLDSIFTDNDVAAICFDARTTLPNNELRCTYCAPQTAGGTRTANWCYELNSNGWGGDYAWKTFTFKRAYMDNFPSNFEFLKGKFAGATTAQSVFVSNIRPVTAIPDSYGFECGAASGLTFRTAGHSQTGCADYENPSQIFSVSGNVNKMSLDSTQRSEGNTSLKVEKINGYSAFTLSAAAYSALGANGYVDVDIRSDVAANSKDEQHGNAKNFLNNLNHCISDVDHPELVGNYQHPANKWVTYRFYASNKEIGTDGRFLIIQGSTGGNWWFDNIRLVHVD